MNAFVSWLLRAMARLSLRGAQSFGGLLGSLFFYFSPRSRRVCRTNIRRCLADWDAPAQKRLLRDCFREMGKTAAEMGWVWYAPEQRLWPLVRKVHGEQALRDAIALNRGVILASPHLGCWELAGLYLSKHYTITSLYRPPRLQALERTVRAARERFGAKLVPTDAGGVKQLFSALARGELIGILPDQDPGQRGNGYFVPFFGHSAKTMGLIAKLAKKTKAPVLITCALRLPQGAGFEMLFMPLPENIGEMSVESALTEINRVIEQGVRMQPAQYQWPYKRFRSRPAGEKKWY